MPLWDLNTSNFGKRPYCDKKQQNLYKRSIMEDNWANVWKNIPINPKLKYQIFIYYKNIL